MTSRQPLLSKPGSWHSSVFSNTTPNWLPLESYVPSRRTLVVELPIAVWIKIAQLVFQSNQCRGKLRRTGLSMNESSFHAKVLFHYPAALLTAVFRWSSSFSRARLLALCCLLQYLPPDLHTIIALKTVLLSSTFWSLTYTNCWPHLFHFLI